MAKNKAKMNKFLTGAITATMVATAVAPVASAASFTDLDNVGANVKAEIDKAVELGYFKDADKFNPADNITRGQAALTLARHIVGSTDASTEDLIKFVENNELEDKVKAFTDVPASHKDGAEFQAELYYASLIVKDAGAFTQDTLTPTDYVTRSQMAKIISSSFGLEKLKGFESAITDIDHLDAETKSFIETIESHEVTNVTTFHPAGSVTRSQMASFLVRAYDVVNEDTDVAPELVSVSAITSKSIKATFKGNAKELTAQDFNVSGGLTVVDVAADSANSAVLTFSRDMVDGAEYELQLLNEEGNVSSKASFKYVLGQVANIALTKSAFEVGENVKDFLKVYDDNGVEISTADYNVVNVESSNTAVVTNAGAVSTLGTSNLRFEIEYKDGSKTKSDFIRIDVEQAVTAAVAGFELAPTAQYDNTVDYRLNGAGAKTSFFVSDVATYLHVYADDSKTNPEIAPLDLSTSGGYTVTSKTPTVIAVTQDVNGAELDPISNGKATIEITGPNNYKKTVSIEVKEDPVYKDLLVGATSVKISDEAVASAVGVDSEEVLLQYVDQHGVKNIFTVDPTATPGDPGYVNVVSDEEIIITDAIETGDKLVISAAQTNGAFELTGVGADSKLTITAIADKVVKNASVRVSYYADANADKATTQKIISTSVVDVDPSIPAYDYETILDKPAIDAFGSNHTATVTAFAVDKNGNRIADVTSDITLTANEAVSVPEAEWFDLSGSNTVTFEADSYKFLTEAGAVKLNYTVAGSSDPHGTVTVAYSNSFKAPDKAVVSTSPVLVDVSSTGDFATGITVEELLFGKILTNSPELVIDDAPTAADMSIAIKKGFTGYANKPVLSFQDNEGTAVLSGAGLYGLLVDNDTTGNGYLIDTGAYDADTEFEVEYTITNSKDLTGFSANNDLDDVLTIAGSADQASFTLVVTKVTVAGDPRVNNAGAPTAKNLLDSPKSVNVILKD